MHQDMKVWKQVFQELIREVKPWHTWKLTLDKSLLPNILKPGWAQYQQWTFARFQCSSCSRSWASAQVQVLFHMHWSEGESRGQVKMRVFAQRCQKCSQPSFEVPKFTEENISRILNNLVLRILKKCYREGFTLVEIPMIKEISLEGPHDSDNCEACLQGFCVQTASLPTSWSPRANTNVQAERRDQNCFNDCTFYSHTAQHTRSLGVSCCCLILIIIIVIVVKTTI
ncbi:receptor-transporting protein 3 [Mesoplodon densirostris]|uniref:receptor-transporting protein 3 n=1 Tax=Mesoplodon densirostris TaxID=48708 RepID=UPI0028DB3159|nr:receptor-transporting protein 3 [Mesoplodon densirostris]